MEKRIVLASPGYGSQTSAAGRGLWRACQDMTKVTVLHLNSSLLAGNFNGCWCAALNKCLEGRKVDYFAMLHSDVGPDDFWLDVLIEELEARDLDVLGVGVPIKDQRGLTSLAIDGETTWRPKQRITMRELASLPETFTSEDVGGPLLLNTGCWVCRFDPEWAKKVHFTVNDRIVYNKAFEKYQAECEPEDWFFSRLCHELGLKIGATRKVVAHHRGEIDYANDRVWGACFDEEYGAGRSVVENFFPADVEGWLEPEEGFALRELAKDKDVLEIGSYLGRSAICLAQTANSLACVDYWDGRDTPKPRDTKPGFMSATSRYNVADKITTYHADDEIPGKYDLVFIDGAHDYESVRADIRKALDHLRPEGVIAFHDYDNGEDPDVKIAVDEFISEGAEMIDKTRTVAVVRPAFTLTEDKSHG